MRRLVQDTFAEPEHPGTLDGEPLVIHQRSEPTRTRALVIFVHGLGGSRYGRGATWGFLPRFVFEDFPDVDVGLYEYVTLLRRLKFWQSIHLSKEAVVFADVIRDVTPYDVVILIGHSMGGLLCEAAIASLLNSAQGQAIQKIHGMILMATPQTGSQRVPSFLRFFSKDAYALRPHGDFVTSLRGTLGNWLWPYEKGDPPGKQYTVPTWAVLGASDFWVDQLSAGIGLPDSQKKMARGSHTQIVKPDSKQHDCYAFVRECIRKAVARYSGIADAQRHAEERHLAVRTPAERIPAVGIFFERRELMARFVEFLNDQSRQLVIIGGLPGIGKTAFAAKAAHESARPFKAIFWMTCSPERSTVDVLFGQLHSFLERHGDEALRGLWNASAPDLLTAKIDALVEALNENSYLLIFDEFSSWLDEQLQVKNPELRRVLHAFISSAHRSKILLISERKPFFDPQASPIPAGVAQNEELFGLEESDGVRLLKEYLPYEDENLLRRTVQICGANPRMLNWFGYLVAHGREDIKTLLASEGAELSGKLLAKSVEGLTRESQDALERLAVFRRPLKKQDLDQLHVSFHKAVAPLLDRFLATWCPKDNSVTLAQPAKALVRARLGHERRRSLHLEAVGFYAAEQSATEPTAFRDVLPILEKAYHLAEAGQGQEATDVFLGVSKSLTEWGYLDLVQEYVGGALEASKADPLRRARCLWTLADVHDLRSQYPEALDRFQESLQEFESVQDYEGVASCRWRLGRVRNALGEFASALEDFQTCIEICDQRKVTGAKAAALLDQGWTLAQQGSRDQALALMERSLELATSSDDYQTQISAGRQIGWILWDYRGENQKARECYERALEIGVKRGFLKELGAVHGDLGYLLTQWGDTEAAEESCRAAIKIREALGDQHGLASSYLNLGLVFHTRNATVEETRCYEESLAIYRRLKVPGGQAEVLLRQGIAWRKRAQYTESENALKQALGIVKSHDLKLILADVQHELGRTLRLAGRDEEAGTWLVSAAEEADKIGSPRAAEYAQFAKPIVN